MEAATNSIENIQATNRKLIERIFESPEYGEVKEASVAGTNMIRSRLREEGYTRRIIPAQTVTNDDLDRVLTHDRPVIIEDMEPDSPAAKSIPFGDSPEIAFYFGRKYQVVFNEITTPEFTKDINELRTYRMDLRQVVTDNSLKDVQTEEDGKFIGMVNTICGSPNGVGASGFQQNFTVNGGITRQSYRTIVPLLQNMLLNNGVFLMNRTTATQFLGWFRNEVGGDLAQDLFKEGLTALQEAKIFGIKHIFTIKRDIIADGQVFLFTEPGFLGKFYELQPLTMFIQRKKNILSFSARETLGVTIANVKGVALATFSI